MLMEETTHNPEKRRIYLSYIRDESERLTRLIENVLQLARLEKEDWKISLSQKNPVVLLESIRKKLEDPAKRAGFELQIIVDGKPRDILVDEDALTQVLLNI